jgi:hypothetical protein
MKTVILMFLILSSYQTLAQTEADCSGDAGFKNKQELLKFTDSLKTADSTETISPFISFPLRVNVGSKRHFMIKNERELKIRFKETFSDQILKVIHDQDPKSTFCNYQGLSIGDGTVWINKKNGKTGIYVVNLRAK